MWGGRERESEGGGGSEDEVGGRVIEKVERERKEAEGGIMKDTVGPWLALLETVMNHCYYSLSICQSDVNGSGKGEERESHNFVSESYILTIYTYVCM